MTFVADTGSVAYEGDSHSFGSRTANTAPDGDRTSRAAVVAGAF